MRGEERRREGGSWWNEWVRVGVKERRESEKGTKGAI